MVIITGKKLQSLILFFIDILNVKFILLLMFQCNQQVEKINYDENFSLRFSDIKRHPTRSKLIKSLKTPFSLGFNITTYQQCNVSKMSGFDVFSKFGKFGNINREDLGEKNPKNKQTKKKKKEKKAKKKKKKKNN